MIGEQYSTIEALKKHIEEAQYLLKVATEKGAQIKKYAKMLHPKFVKDIYDNDKELQNQRKALEKEHDKDEKLRCHFQTFYDLVMDAVLN